MPRDIETIKNTSFLLYASEKDMEEAEKAVLGFQFCHLSTLDWHPSDEDDEKPDNCDRVIEYCPGTTQGKSILHDMFKIAAYLGDRCWLSVGINAGWIYTNVDTTGRNRMSVFENHLHDAMRKRISRAVNILQGSGGPSDE